MIKAIFFDQGGVLVCEAGSEQIELLSKASGASFEHCKMIRKKYWNKLKLGYITDDEYWQGTTNYGDLGRGVLNELTIDKSEYLSLRHSSIKAIKLFDFSKPLLNQLSKKYILGIISNNSKEWGENVLKAGGIDQYFKILIYSHTVGLAKPDKKIYTLTFSKLTHVSPEEILLIDDKEKSLIPARELGWNTLLFKSYDKLIKDLGALSVEIT